MESKPESSWDGGRNWGRGQRWVPGDAGVGLGVVGVEFGVAAQACAKVLGVAPRPTIVKVGTGRAAQRRAAGTHAAQCRAVGIRIPGRRTRTSCDLSIAGVGRAAHHHTVQARPADQSRTLVGPGVGARGGIVVKV